MNIFNMAKDLKGMEKMMKPALEKFMKDSGFVKKEELTKLEKDDISKIEEKVSDIKRIEVNNEVLQLSTAVRFLPDVVDFHTEIYQDTAFISHREATKLHAVHKLLRYINWSGQVSVFGDGVYDIELLNYFDGVLVTPSTHYNVIKGRANV